MIMCCMTGIVCSDKPTENYQLHAAFEHLAQFQDGAIDSGLTTLVSEK